MPQVKSKQIKKILIPAIIISIIIGTSIFVFIGSKMGTSPTFSASARAVNPDNSQQFGIGIIFSPVENGYNMTTNIIIYSDNDVEIEYFLPLTLNGNIYYDYTMGISYDVYYSQSLLDYLFGNIIEFQDGSVCQLLLADSLVITKTQGVAMRVSFTPDQILEDIGLVRCVVNVHPYDADRYVPFTSNWSGNYAYFEAYNFATESWEPAIVSGSFMHGNYWYIRNPTCPFGQISRLSVELGGI